MTARDCSVLIDALAAVGVAAEMHLSSAGNLVCLLTERHLYVTSWRTGGVLSGWVQMVDIDNGGGRGWTLAVEAGEGWPDRAAAEIVKRVQP